MTTTTRIINNKLMKNIIEQFEIGGYEVIKDNESVIVKLNNEEVFRALTHSSRKNWLARYNSNVLTKRKG